MITYIYFVKCPNCEDEHFDFFDEAKEFALGCLSQKPIITQTEVCRNDFGECTDSADLGTVWSWEEAMKDTEGGYTEAEPAISVFTKDDLRCTVDEQDPEFDALDNSVDFDIEEDSISTVEDAIDFLVKDEEEAIAGYEKVEDAIEAFEVENKKEILDTINHIKVEEEEHIEELEALLDIDKAESTKAVHERKPVPEGMTIEALVEEMEENEDTVECTLCNDLFSKSDCRKEVNLGWLCGRCEAAVKSRGETLTFKEGNYCDFLGEDIKQPIDEEMSLADLVKDSINHLVNDIGEDPWTDDFADDVIKDIENNYDIKVPEDIIKYNDWCSSVASEVSRQVNSDYKLDEDTNELHDLSNEYDGGYPTEKLVLPEIDEVSDSHLKLCPECGKETFDIETGICVNCGFN